MATIKSFTDLQQSKKLAEILPLESADMWWLYITAQGKYIAMMHEEPDPHYLARMESYGIKDAAIRCWSLAALLGVLPAECECMSLEHINYGNNHKKYFMHYIGGENTEDYDNPIDACYEMIVKLYKMNLL